MNWALLLNSVGTSALATALAGAVGFAVAVFAMGLGTRWRPIVFGIAALAFAMPPFYVTNAWLGLLGPAGPLHRLLPVQVASWTGVSLLLASMLWPVPMFSLIGAWQKLGREYFETEPLLRGAALFRWLLIPCAAPAFGLGMGLTFVLVMNNFAVPAVLQVKVLPVEVYVLANTTLDYMGALVMSWPLVLGPLLLLAVLRAKQINWSWRTAETCPAVWKRSVGRTWFAICGMACGIVGILSVIVPVAEPIRNADTWRVINSTWLASSEVVVRSACVAAIGGLLILLVGSLLSRISGGFFSWVLFLIPGVVFGIVLIEAFNRPPFLVLYRSVAVMFVALVLRYAAVGRTGVLAAKSAVDRNLVDAARLDGATAWQTFKHASWPQMKASLAVTWYVAYLLCLWDVETILFVVPPGAETLPLRIFNLLHYGHNPEINALCLMMLVLAVLPLFVWVTLHWPGQRPRSSVANREQNLAAGRRANTTCRAAGTALIALGLLTGCSRETPSRADLRSRLFSHVEIIGSRGTAPGQFNKPRSLTVDGQDNLYVADMTGRIQKFAPDGTWLLSWMMPETDLGKPKGMGIDKDGYVIVVEPHYSRINHFNSHGVLVRQWGQHGTNAGQLVFPRAVAVNKAGDIFVSEYGRVDRIQRFSSDGTRLLGVIGAYGYGPGQLNRPEGLAIDKEERLYVADSCNHRIQVFAPDGSFLRTYGGPGHAPGQMSYPYDICVDRAGYKFVCEFGNSRIQVFDAEDRHVELIGGAGRAPGQFANPWSVALDSKGNLYVADAGNDRVQKFVRR